MRRLLLALALTAVVLVGIGSSTVMADYNWLFFYKTGVQFRNVLPPELEAALAKAPPNVRLETERCIMSQGLGAGAVHGILQDLKAGRSDHRCQRQPTVTRTQTPPGDFGIPGTPVPGGDPDGIEY